MSNIDCDKKRNNDSIKENSTLTSEDVQTIAQKAFHESSIKVISYSLNPYSKEKLGFTASHQLLQITVQKKNCQDSETVNLFVKSPSKDCKDQAELVNEGGIFDHEVEFFHKIAPILKCNYMGEKWSPVCYLVKNKTMIMEDLRSEGYKLKGQFFDDTLLIKSALAALARFHSSTIIGETHLKKLLGKSVTFKDQYPEGLEEKVFLKHNVGIVGQWISTGIDVVVAVAEKCGIQSKKLRDAFDNQNKLTETSDKYRNVICHGDLWTNNIMFDDTKPMPRCVFVDYQCIRYAPLVLDILQLLYVNSSRSYREKYEKELIEFYHGVLLKSVKFNNTIKTGDLPSLEEIMNAYSHYRLFGICIANLYLSFVLIDSKTINEKLESDGFFETLFGDRIKFTLEYMKKDFLYKTRVEEAVRELAEMC